MCSTRRKIHVIKKFALLELIMSRECWNVPNNTRQLTLVTSENTKNIRESQINATVVDKKPAVFQRLQMF